MPASSPSDSDGGGLLDAVLPSGLDLEATRKEIHRFWWSLSQQTATLFLGAVAFAVAMSWNSTVQAILDLWTPKDTRQAKSDRVRFSAIASACLTILAVLLAAVLTKIYGEKVHVGQAKTYGL